MNTATPAQIALINKLKGERDISMNSARLSGEVALDTGRDLWRQGLFTRDMASRVINVLTACPKKAAPTPSEGMHKFGGVIFKVLRAVNGSGHLYAKALVWKPCDEPLCDEYHGCAPVGRWGFEYVQGAVNNLSEATRLDADEAAEFGQLYGVCCVCGRTLTDEESIARGIGPVCLGKL